jgi:hypothetical protein
MCGSDDVQVSAIVHTGGAAVYEQAWRGVRAWELYEEGLLAETSMAAHECRDVPGVHEALHGRVCCGEQGAEASAAAHVGATRAHSRIPCPLDLRPAPNCRRRPPGAGAALRQRLLP